MNTDIAAVLSPYNLPIFIMRMRSLLWLFAVIVISACQAEDHFDNPIPIYYDYQKGFSTDTLSRGIRQDSFSNTIDSIEKIVVDLTSYNDVFLAKKFIAMYENPERYMNNVLTYLADTTNTRQERTIAFLAMQKKGLVNNLNFLYACNFLYRNGLIDEEMISRILYPIDLSNCDIIKHYKSEQIRKVLLDVRYNKRTSNSLKEVIDDVLSGKAYKERKRFLADQYNVDI
jgi:hypothetical protein